MARHLKIEWRVVPPTPGLIGRMIERECPDCDLAVEIEEDAREIGKQRLRYRHDPTCPELIRKEQEREAEAGG